MRSPQSPRSDFSLSKPKFDNDSLKAYIKKLLSSTLQSQSWADLKDRDKLRAFIKEISERIKERMIEIQPRGFKYVVLTQVNENLGQGGRVDILCHWQEGDCVAQEMFANVSMPIRSQWIIPSKTDTVNPGLPDLYMHSTGHLLIVSPVLDTLHHHSHTVIRRYPLQSMENSLTDRLHGLHPDLPLLH